MKFCTIGIRIPAFCILLLSGHQLFAADPIPIHWTATATTAALPLSKGAKVTARVTATIAPGWHLYAFEQESGGPLPTSVSVASGQAFAAADLPAVLGVALVVAGIYLATAAVIAQ